MIRRFGVAGAVGWTLAALVPLTLLGVFFLLPVGSILQLGLAPAGVLDVAGALEVLGRPRTGRVVATTLGLAAAATGITLLVGLPVAFALSRLRFRGRAALRAIVLVPFVLPTVVVGIAFRSLLRDTPLDGTPVAIVLALVFFNVAVVARTVGASWASLSPRPEEAARMLGAGPARVFAGITLRRLAPSVASATALVFLYCATAFGTVLVLGGARVATVETEIWLLTTQFLDLRAASVLSLAQLAVVAGLLLATAGARATTPGERRAFVDRPPRRADAPALAVTGLVVLAILAPLAALVERALRVPGGWGVDHFLALATTGRGAALAVSPWTALGHSLAFATVAAALALLVGGLASLVLSRRPRAATARRALDLFDGLLMLPLGVSAVTLGFGFLVALDTPPLDLRASPIIVPLAQALVAVPLVVRTLLPVLRGVGQRMRDAAATLGASPSRVLWTIDLGIAGRAVAAAAGLAFAVALGEFGATSFLSRPDDATLPVLVYRLFGLPGAENAGMAAAASVVLAAVCVAVVAVVERLRVPTAGAL